MSDQERWLISLSIGPVQDFIDAALRTRDLWFGSHMLSEVSKEAAIAIKKYNPATVDLIFPAAESSSELKPIEREEINVANRIVAEVNGNQKTVQAVINAGKEAAKERLLEFIEQARNKANINLRDEVWKRQANPDDLLELYGTAVRRIKEKDYQEAWERLSRLNSARKNSRDFLQPAQKPNEEGLYGLPKSSLDGRRETVLQEVKDKEKDKRIRRKLRMGDGEQLDVLGLVKRLAGEDPDQFTPTTRIAIDPWIRKIITTSDGEGSVKAIRNELEKLAKLESDFITHVKGNNEIYSVLPFDGGQLYQGVLDTLLCKKELKEEQPREYHILKHLQKEILPTVRKNHGSPCPYYAMLLADGDNMGRLIKAATSKGHHKEISYCLSKFARSVPDIAREYCAHCIYSGGDDVLLMAPLDTVLLLAEELRTAFTETLQDIAKELRQKKPDLKDPTFSVGIVIAHMQTPIGRVRRLVQKAEALAKGADKQDSRNALAIIVAPRSGADISFRASWEKNPVATLNALADLYRNDKLPSGFGYELRQVGLLLNGLKNQEKANKIAELELERILKRKKQSGSGKEVDEDTKKAVLDHAKEKAFDDVWQEHLIARWLGAHGEDRE